ncbi:MAG: hypothetical protein PHV63_04205 [Candidatus Daviesbacteria bacterium]|nr:hypothetical protein [Candidatus Daviesbacteria bacterium]
MIYFLTFLFELILLFFLSKKLINSLAKVIYRLTKSHRAVVHILAFIFLPGTIIHELAHLLFAGVMLVPVGEMSVLPEIEEKGVKLGSVQIGYTDPLRRMIVGVAPVLLGMILIFSIFLLVKIGTSPWWQVILAIYLLFEIGNTMFSSRKDIEGSILFVILILMLSIIALIALYFLNPALIHKIWLWLNGLNLEGSSNFFKTASIYLIASVVLDFSVILLTRPFAGKA